MTKLKTLVIAAIIILSAATLALADGVTLVKAPVAGAHMEAGLVGPVAYAGMLTMYWTRAIDGAGNPVWNHTSILEGEAWRLADGVRFRIFSACEDCTDPADSGTITMNEPFWAVGVPGLPIPIYRGALKLVVQLPQDRAPPAVTLVALTTK